MIRATLESAAGMGIYPIISLAIFFSFFMGMLVWVVITRKQQISDWANLPLNEAEEIDNNKSTKFL